MDTESTTAPATPTPVPAVNAAVAARVARRRRRRAGAADPVGAWAEEIRTEAFRIASGQHRPFDADDIANTVVERFLADPATHMTGCPSPGRFARAATTNAGHDHRRREQAQRGAGAYNGRAMDSLDAEEVGDRFAGTPAIAGASHPGDPADLVADRLAVEAILARIADDTTRAIVGQHVLTGDRVTEIAGDRGVSHATISNRIKQARLALGTILVDAEYVSAS